MSFINPKYNFNNHALKVGTDCSGIETILIAMKMLNINYIHKWACDNDKKVKALIMKYHKPELFFDDIFKRDHSLLPHIDLYICGFCCQSFSQIGLKQGTDIKKGQIFYECKKVIETKQPKYFILENVNGLITHNKSVYKLIQDEFYSLDNYNVSFNICNTLDYGIPQSRKRLYIIGTRKDMKCFEMPLPIKCDDLSMFIDDDLPSQVEKCLIPRRLKVLNHLIEKNYINVDDNWVITLGASIQYARSSLNICQAITTNSSMLYLTSKKRFLVLKELYYLQGFIDEYLYNELCFKQIGNSMSINVLYYILVGLLSPIILSM